MAGYVTGVVTAGDRQKDKQFVEVISCTFLAVEPTNSIFYSSLAKYFKQLKAE